MFRVFFLQLPDVGMFEVTSYEDQEPVHLGIYWGPVISPNFELLYSDGTEVDVQKTGVQNTDDKEPKVARA